MKAILPRAASPLFFRLFLIFSATVIFFFVIISLSLRQLDQSWRDERLSPLPDFYLNNINQIVDSIGIPPDLNQASQLAQDLSLTIIIRSPHINWQSDEADDLDIGQAVFVRQLSDEAQMLSVGNEDVIRVARGGYEYFLNRKVASLSDYDYFVIYLGLALGVLVLFLNYWLVRRLLEPVRQLREGAERICAGELDYRVETQRTDELGELTNSVNHMADSLQSMLEAKRQLLLAISHELRTPITRAKLQLEFVDEGPVRDNLRDDIDEIDLLISDLIEAERLSGQHSALVADEIDFVAYVSLILEQYEDYPGGLKKELPRRDRAMTLDKLRIRLLITNILNNAVRYGRGNPITVTVVYRNSEAVLEVHDQGEGIAKEHLSHISEPFYRPDSSRQRHTGGFGLGLYLCRLIAEAHGGTLEIESELGVGTCVRVRLPLQAPPPSIRAAAGAGKPLPGRI